MCFIGFFIGISFALIPKRFEFGRSLVVESLSDDSITIQSFMRDKFQDLNNITSTLSLLNKTSFDEQVQTVFSQSEGIMYYGLSNLYTFDYINDKSNVVRAIS